MKKMLAATLAALAVSLLSLFAGSPAHATTGPVTVTVKVRGCDGCSVQAIWAPSLDTPGAVWNSRPHTVRNGRVTITMSRRHTQGLYFDVHDRHAIATGARTLAVSRYAGTTVGSPVSGTTASTATRGQHCWAGTTAGAATLHLTVARFTARDTYDHHRGYAIRPYFSPTLHSFGHASGLWRGTIGAQDVFFCKN